MKFQHLPIGARFEFEGKRFTKTSPLVASEEGGGQRMIPRYAMLRSLSVDIEVPPSTPGLAVDMADVLVAFAAFESVVGALLHEACGAADKQLLPLQSALTEAGQLFRNKIKHP